MIENYEPASWAEELIEPAQAVDHRLLAALYVMASQCYRTGRIDEAVALCDAGQAVIGRKPDALPFAMESMLGGPYTYQGRPDRWLETCRTQLDQRRGNPLTVRACLVFALVMIGAVDDAVDATTGLIEAAEATKNPFVVSFVLTAYGFAYRDIDPVRALVPLRRGLAIAQYSGNRFNETQLALALSRLEAMHGDPVVAFDHIALAIRNMHDSGNSSTMSSPLAILAALFDRLGRYEPAATIAGSALTTLTALAFPEISTAIAHLRNVLGDQTYESLAHKGRTMTTATMAAYAYDQIDQAKTELA